MMADDGWIKLHRSAIESDVFQHPGIWHLFCYLLMKANHQPRSFLIPGTLQSITVKRGSIIVCRRSMYAKLYPQKNQFTPSPSTMWRWLAALSDMKSVTVEDLNRSATLVTICNYETYQKPEKKVEPVVGQTWASDGPVVGHIQELKNVSIQESDSSPGGTSTCFDGCNQAFLEISDPDSGDMLNYATDEMRWQWLFIARWNSLPGVAIHSDKRLSTFAEAELLKRFQERDWDWRTAMMAFPVNFERMSLVKFLEAGMVQKINGGFYRIPDFVKEKNGQDRSGKKNRRGSSEIGPGQRFDAEGADTRGVNDF